MCIRDRYSTRLPKPSTFPLMLNHGNGMVTKMKKLTFLIYHKDYECFLQNIRDLGVVHVAEKAQGTAENTELQRCV